MIVSLTFTSPLATLILCYTCASPTKIQAVRVTLRSSQGVNWVDNENDGKPLSDCSGATYDDTDGEFKLKSLLRDQYVSIPNPTQLYFASFATHQHIRILDLAFDVLPSQRPQDLCDFETLVTLDSNLECYGAECNVDTVKVVEVLPGVY